MKIDSKLFRFVFVSPWPLTIFFIIPSLVILNATLHIRMPFAGAKIPLLVNNSCFALLIALRLIFYILGLFRPIRYGATHRAPGKSKEMKVSAGTLRNSLANAGYVFDSGGNYGEKRDRGYIGAMLLYAGLFVVLFTGTLDNMRQFSGTLMDGIGMPTDLNLVEKYRNIVTGPFTTAPTTLPKMKIVRQLMPDAAYPRGATEVAFLFADGKEQKTILKSPDPFRAGAYDIYMSKMVYEPRISIIIDNASPVFVGTIQLDPLVKKENGYGFYGAFVYQNLDGEAYYQPEKSRLKVILRQGSNILMNKELIFQVDRQQTLGNISFTCERMGVWSEIHVVRRRHMPVIILGGIIALIGLVMRIAIRPQRVWLEETQDGCRMKAVGGETKRLLRDEG